MQRSRAAPAAAMSRAASRARTLRMASARFGRLVCFMTPLLAAVAPLHPAVAADETPGKGVRTLVLVRHGAYDEADPRDPDIGRALTAEGQEQARLAGARLARLGIRFDALHASTMTRARQTAEIIGRDVGLAPQLSRDLRECTPPTVRADVMALQSAGGPDSCRQALERAWSRYLRPSPERDSTEIMVCHGNVIRYLVSRVLGLGPALWLNMSIANCSVSMVQVRADGRTRLVSFDDVGHLALPTQRPPAWPLDPPPKRSSQR
jgi:serine/threonine-protein phosphatase PGAM5